MPIYEYRCRQCSQDFEWYVPSAANAVACPACSSDRVTRKLSVFAARSASAPFAAAAPTPAGGGGGCCGGGCSCA